MLMEPNPDALPINTLGTTLSVRDGDGGGAVVEWKAAFYARHETLATITVGTAPFGVTVDASSKRAFVANVQSSDVSVVDLSTFTVTGTFAVGSFPYAIAHVADSDRLFVTNQHDNTVSVIDLPSGQTLRTVTVGDYPEGIMLHPDGRHVYVVSWFDGEVYLIDTATLEVTGHVKSGNGSRGFGDFIAPR